MDKQKQIEEITKILCQNEIDIERCADCNLSDYCSHVKIPARELYDAGYRKQSEGEWVIKKEEYGFKLTICSVCGEECPIETETDSYGEISGEFYVKSPFCPNCGSKMKGGEG